MSDEKHGIIKTVSEFIGRISSSWLTTKNTLVIGFFCLYSYMVAYKDESPFYEFANKIYQLTKDEPQLKSSEFSRISSELIASGATSASIFSVNLGQGTRSLEYCQIGENVCTVNIGDSDFLYKRINPSDPEEVLIEAARYNEGVYVAQSGGFVCGPHKPVTRYGAKLSDNGVVFGCAIGVPSGISDYFIGVIAVGFKKELSRNEMEFIKSEMFRHSRKISD